MSAPNSRERASELVEKEQADLAQNVSQEHRVESDLLRVENLRQPYLEAYKKGSLGRRVLSTALDMVHLSPIVPRDLETQYKNLLEKNDRLATSHRSSLTLIEHYARKLPGTFSLTSLKIDRSNPQPFFVMFTHSFRIGQEEYYVYPEDSYQELWCQQVEAAIPSVYIPTDEKSPVVLQVPEGSKLSVGYNVEPRDFGFGFGMGSVVVIPERDNYYLGCRFKSIDWTPQPSKEPQPLSVDTFDQLAAKKYSLSFPIPVRN